MSASEQFFLMLAKFNVNESEHKKNKYEATEYGLSVAGFIN